MNSGGCFCGAVRYRVSAPMMPVTYCHCAKCRSWHGHVGAYTAVDRAGFELTEVRGLAWHSVSPTVRRAFCSICGSSLLFDETSSPKMSMCAGTLDQPTGLTEKAHIYVGSKGDYYDIGGALPQYDTMPKRTAG